MTDLFAYWWTMPIAFAFSLLAVWMIRAYAVRKNIVDIPNARSSHQVPTPRGGGLGIVISFFLLLLFPWLKGDVPSGLMAALVLGGLVIAAVGFLDDLLSLSPGWRILAQALASVTVLVCIRGVPSVHIMGVAFQSAIVLNVLGFLFLIWVTNLYNFMDGIDGVAGTQAVTMCSGMLVVLMFVDVSFPGAVHFWLLLGSSAGFLCWNWPPARIFMGDVGSGFLGFVFAVECLYAAQIDLRILAAMLILLAVFVCDATTTLLRRMVRKQPLHVAHRSHAYQHVSRRFNSHRVVTLSVALINLVWLLPLAVLTAAGFLTIGLGIVVAYLPLVAVAVFLDAGSDD